MYSEDKGACTVLLVDDSVETLQLVGLLLQNAGYNTILARSGEEGLDIMVAQGVPHLAIVDFNMPQGMGGFEFCEQLSQFSDTPVIMLTAVDEERVVVQAIRRFAEDYVTKPFNPPELVARVRRVLQRVGEFPYPMSSPIRVDSQLQVDFPGRQVRLEEIVKSMTPTEAKLLYILMRTPGRAVETGFLLQRMWPLEMAQEDRLHVYVHRLRSKLRSLQTGHRYIASERTIGYRFQPLEP